MLWFRIIVLTYLIVLTRVVNPCYNVSSIIALSCDMVKAYVMVLARVVVLAHGMVKTHIMVLANVIFLAHII